MKDNMRWLYVPFWFGLFVYLAWVARWFPASLERWESAYGQGQVIAAHVKMVWPAALRAAVAFGVTVVGFLLLPPVTRKQGVWVLLAAVIVEISMEVVSLLVFGLSVSTTLQLTMTAAGYALVVAASAYILRRYPTSG